MKQRIGTRVYDTATAQHVAGIIYRKRSGEYFAAGSRIRPLETEEAQRLIHQYGETPDKIRATFDISPEAVDKIKALAKQWDCSRSEVLEKIIRDL